MNTKAGARFKIVSLGSTLYATGRVAFPPRVFLHIDAGGIRVDVELTPDESREMGCALAAGADGALDSPARVNPSLRDPALDKPAGSNGGSP